MSTLPLSVLLPALLEKPLRAGKRVSPASRSRRRSRDRETKSRCTSPQSLFPNATQKTAAETGRELPQPFASSFARRCIHFRAFVYIFETGSPKTGIELFPRVLLPQLLPLLPCTATAKARIAAPPPAFSGLPDARICGQCAGPRAGHLKVGSTFNCGKNMELTALKAQCITICVESKNIVSSHYGTWGLVLPLGSYGEFASVLLGPENLLKA